MLGLLKCFRPDEERNSTNAFPLFLDDICHYIGTCDIVYTTLSFKTGLDTIEVRVYNHHTLIMHGGRRMFHVTFPFEKICHHQNLSDATKATIVVNHSGDILLYRALFNKFITESFKIDIIGRDT